MSVTQLVKTIGDRDNQFHRSALAGNAMRFYNQRWVKLTAGADSIPLFDVSVPFTIITSFYRDTPATGGDGGTPLICQDVRNAYYFHIGGTSRMYKNLYGGRGISFQVVAAPGHPNISPWTGSQVWRYGRNIIAWANPGNAQTISDIKCLIGGRLIQTIPHSTGTSSVNLNFLNIGRRETDTHHFFTGYIRSIEVVMRFLNNEELRRVFNFGTAYAAGLITPADISIDFNRINGQAPICRPGSRQVTVQVYNYNTPDNSVAEYADWYSL